MFACDTPTRPVIQRRVNEAGERRRQHLGAIRSRTQRKEESVRAHSMTEIGTRVALFIVSSSLSFCLSLTCCKSQKPLSSLSLVVFILFPQWRRLTK